MQYRKKEQGMDYLYDGSFEGFLSCIYLHYYNEKAAGIYLKDSYQSTLLRPWHVVETNLIWSGKVYDAIESKISSQALKRVYYIFLSNSDEKENIALRYIILGFRLGCSVDSLHSNEAVFDAQQLAYKVSFEAHRFAGLVRFSALDLSGGGTDSTSLYSADIESCRELLYASIGPDHDILELLGGHFADRFKEDSFVIHDTKRDKALYSSGGRWQIAPLNKDALPRPSTQEDFFKKMWKDYFEVIAIKERTNPKCQKRMMPVRYWGDLTEMRRD
jgi:probable DNA metabolism protein